MTQDNRTSSGSGWTPWLLGLAAVVLVAGGVAAGMILAGDEEGQPGSSTSANQTTTTSQPQVTTTTRVTTTSTSPATTTTVARLEVELTIEVSEDATIDSDDADLNFGSEEILQMDYNEPDIHRSLLRFEVEGVPDGHSVVDAQLLVFMEESSNGGGEVSVVDGDWDESSVTWNNAPTLGPTIAPLPVGGEGRAVEIDLTTFVTGNGVVELYLSTFSDDDYAIASKESGQGPSLVLTVTPEAQASEGGRFVMVGAGDIAACDSDGDEATAALIDEALADVEEPVVFTTGDNAYDEGSAANFADCYDPSWGRHKAITRPVPGAREYRTPGASAYFGYFGEAAGVAGEGWYSYDVGAWHVIALNSNCEALGGCGLDTPQGQWLQQDVEASNARCTLAYWHDPTFSSTVDGGHPDLLEFYGFLFESDVEIVVNGDDHFYERFVPQDQFNQEFDEGLRQFTVGTGGRSLSQFGLPAPHSAVRFNEAFGVLVLTLNPNGYEWEFQTVEGSPFTDRGFDICH